MIKFANVNVAEARRQKSGTKVGGDKSPILRATVSKNRFRMNYLMADALNVESGDTVLFIAVPYENRTLFVITKNVNDLENSAKIAGKKKGKNVKQSLDFTYSGVYTEIFNDAAKQLNFDANKRIEVAFKIADETVASQLNDEDTDYGDTPALLLEPASYVERAERSLEDDDEDVEDVEYEEADDSVEADAGDDE